MLLRIGNFNAYKLGLKDRGTDAWKARVTAVRELAPDFLGLQEVVIDEAATSRDQWDAEAAETIAAFAADCGLTAAVPATPGRPHGVAMAANTHRAWYTAALWNPDTMPFAPGSYRPLGSPDFWHGLTVVAFDIGVGELLIVVVYHGDPFRPNWRTEEGLRIKGLLRRTGGVNPAVVVGDFNSVSAALRRRRWWHWRRKYYDAEPYLKQRHDDLEYQVQPHRIGKRFRRQLAYRQQTENLLRGGYMVDAAAHLDEPWHPTVGHVQDGQGDPDPWGKRRIDLILASRPVAPALTAYGIHGSTAARAASDHLMPWITVDPSRIQKGHW
ncbi:endonuclease/exonuclease/phosphatase family protein [Streptomyces phaeolivaceus]|uniref:Endonuclease/exonuclease/phosphatase family protein n=1 Tax=Streptomyces phaeolivaceus TaxID=2653200 RepID=A0A5P8K3U1_9ACTN|nr:endonuclease/exonuclease/phosphatase family protein [Streptomyces phaeolivaceus]QFQ97277.1 endonuclease/exonuclease/phosphatase family protein [Streptomyces phaeolivaceus]